MRSLVNDSALLQQPLLSNSLNRSWQHSEKFHPLLDIAEKLVAPLFQTLPAGILVKYLPKSVWKEHFNRCANVVSLLLQSRDRNGVQRYI